VNASVCRGSPTTGSIVLKFVRRLTYEPQSQDYIRRRMNANQPFITQKTQQAVVALEAAIARAAHERTLLELARMISRIQVNPLVKPLPPVRAAAYRLRAQSERRAAQLAAAMLSRFETEQPSAQSAQLLSDTCEACSRVFPREASLLRRALEALPAEPNRAV
jgi:hypothetical protein